MLTSLFLNDFALIDRATIRFGKGLNILTGESGAGKSIIVSAISQLCGERSSLDFIRTGAKKAVIEAEFDFSERPEIARILQQHDIETSSDILIIRKEINQSGTSRIFINDTPVQLVVLNQVSPFILDLHGQHQHQVLLHPENHLPYLDSFADLSNSVKDFSQLVQKFSSLQTQISQLEKDQAKALQMTDLYNFQLQELENANLDADELGNLKDELKILSNYEKLHQTAQYLVDNLTLGEINAAQLVSNAEENLRILADIDSQFSELYKNLVSARHTIDEIGQVTERYLNNLEYDSERAEVIRQRTAQLEFLLKKYQRTEVFGLIELKEELKSRLNDIENFEVNLKELISEKKQLITLLIKSGQELTLLRKQAAREFESKLNLFSNEIRMDNAQFEFSQSFTLNPDSSFEVNGEKIKIHKNGFDEVLIRFSPNPGEPLKPINKIASGGEISRVMLALKSVLAEKDKMPVLVFDEIDSGISGKVAQIVGKKISELARYHQIICITHLPQIAAFADRHYKVDKITEKSSTRVDIKKLTFEEQITEIANLLGGVSLSKEAMDNASQLLNEAAKIK